jgi:hypothetical protein
VERRSQTHEAVRLAIGVSAGLVALLLIVVLVDIIVTHGTHFAEITTLASALNVGDALVGSVTVGLGAMGARAAAQHWKGHGVGEPSPAAEAD